MDNFSYSMGMPFLKPKHVAGLIVQQRARDGSHEDKPEDHEDQALETASEDLIKAVTAKDAKAAASALRAAFEILDSEPHEESEANDSEPEYEGSGE